MTRPEIHAALPGTGMNNAKAMMMPATSSAIATMMLMGLSALPKKRSIDLPHSPIRELKYIMPMIPSEIRKSATAICMSTAPSSDILVLDIIEPSSGVAPLKYNSRTPVMKEILGKCPYRASKLQARVPTIVVSSLARKGSIDHTQYDTTSILKPIEQRWDMKPLGTRDAKVASLLNALQLQ